MPTPGYSGTPLLKKLGIKPTSKLLVIHAPDNYTKLLESLVDGQLLKTGDTPDIVHLFAENRKVFIAGLGKIIPLCKKNPALVIWVSWYKKASGISTDLTEDIIRETALKNGLVDVKVCAVSENWSGLKLVVPVAKR